jgi:hypothetical protein
MRLADEFSISSKTFLLPQAPASVNDSGCWLRSNLFAARTTLEMFLEIHRPAASSMLLYGIFTSCLARSTAMSHQSSLETSERARSIFCWDVEHATTAKGGKAYAETID